MWNALQESKKNAPDNCDEVLVSLGDLVFTYLQEGRWKAAQDLGMVVVEKRTSLFREEHPSTMTAMGNLTSAYWGQGRWDDAAAVGARVVDM